jgi:hypothetical protein
MLFDAAEQRDLRVRQIIRHFGASDSAPRLLADSHHARIAAGRVGGFVPASLRSAASNRF